MIYSQSVGFCCQDMEWCTLKELKSTADNLKTTLFAEKKYITKFYIQELPNNGGQPVSLQQIYS